MLDKPFAASWRLSGRVGLQEALTLPRIAIENVEPVVEGGRFAAKAIVGQPVTISAVIFTDGHELMAAELLWRHAERSDWHSQPMTLLGNDHWQARLLPSETGRLVFAIEPGGTTTAPTAVNCRRNTPPACSWTWSWRRAAATCAARSTAPTASRPSSCASSASCWNRPRNRTPEWRCCSMTRPAR